jgi:hypothetical protein
LEATGGVASAAVRADYPFGLDQTSQYLKTTVERLQRVARAFDEALDYPAGILRG